MAMHMTERTADGVTVLDFGGRLAGEAADTIADRLDSLLTGGKRKVLLNLGDARFLDSGVLGVLVSKRAEFAHQGGRLTLLNVSAKLSDLLVTTKLERIFDTFDSEAEALKSLEAS
jgi:anti-sigma B factor antagonist